MMSKKHVLVCAVMSLLLAATLFAADDVSTYLILGDISPYKRLVQSRDAYSHKPKTIPGYTSHPGSGVVAGTDHFFADHPDVTCETKYQNDTLGIAVEITKHANSDSDKWLLHEVEYAYRDNDDSDKRLGLLSGAGVKIREINGNKFLYWGLGGGSYAWISGQKVIEIKYTDLQRTMPEPIEVVQAYLQKHASSIPATFALDSAHDVTWIKDEMDRRLWLCDKWFLQLTLKKAEEKQVYQESVKSMNIFLDYREKYYGMKAADEKNLLASYLNTSNGTGIKAKLVEYKNWWATNKDKAISLP